MQKREMRGIDHDCYNCISKTHSHFFGIFLTYENRRKSIFSVKKRKGNLGKSALTAHTLLKLMQTCTHSCKNTRLQVSFPYYFELAPFKAVNSSYQQERMSSFSLAISEQYILSFFYRRLDRLCLSLQYLNCDQVYFHGARKLGEEVKTLSQVIFYFMPDNTTPEKVLKRNFFLTVRPDRQQKEIQ